MSDSPTPAPPPPAPAEPPPAAPEAAEPPADGRYVRLEKSNRKHWTDAGVSLGLVAAGVAAFLILKNLKEPTRPVDRVSPPPLVEVADVTRHVGGLDVTSDGVVVPYRLINVGAEVGGRVVKMDPALRSGRYVTAGQELLTIDPEPYRLEQKRLEAEVRAAASSLAELAVQIENAKGSALIAKKDAELAQAETARQERLRERNSGSLAAVEQARRAELQAKDKLQTAANALRLLQAQQERLGVQKELAETNLERAELDLSRTTVTSPVDGVIVSAEVEEGGRVQAGGPLFTINDSSRAEVRTNLLMKDVAWILAHPPEGTRPTDLTDDAAAYALPSVPVTVRYELMGNVYTWDGVLNRAEGTGIDEATRTVPCRVTVENPRSVSMGGGSGALPVAGPRALVRGMFVTVLVHTDPAESLLEVPEQAVRPGSRVWAVRDGKLRIAELPVVAIVGGKVLIPPHASPLEPGDRVVTSPLPAATPGMSVRVAGDADTETNAERGPAASAVAGSEEPESDDGGPTGVAVRHDARAESTGG